MLLSCILDVYLSFLFVCTESLTLVSDPTSRRFVRWLLFQTFIYIYIYIYIKQIVHGTEGHMTVYGPGCHPQNIIWTVHILFCG